MVLTARASARRSLVAMGLAAKLLAGTSAFAQEMQTSTAVEIPESVFVPTTLTVGGATVEIGAAARFEYDNNIYAQAFDGVEDVKFLFRPFVGIAKQGSTLEAAFEAQGDIRKFFKHKSEDAAGGSAKLNLMWSPSSTDKIGFVGGWQHIIEDRGEPEGLTTRKTGPRQLDSFDGDVSFAHQGPKLGFLVRGTGATFRYEDPADRNRNLDNYGVLGRISYRLAPLLNGFAEGFVSKRDFKRPPVFNEADRDSHTYGGRLGMAVDPGGSIRGETAAGVYRFDPKDQRIDGRTGVSAEVAMTFQPRERLAFNLEGFIGNVATYRTGAQSRQDTRIRLGIQQEVRHNLRWQASFLYRRSRYYGTGITDDIYGGTFEAEYVINRRIAAALVSRYANRSSTAPLSEYSRLRLGVEFRAHY